MNHLRLISGIALVVFGIAVTFAAADSLTILGPRTIEPNGEVVAPIGGATDEPAEPAHDELGAILSGVGDAGERDQRTGAKSGRDGRDTGAEGEQRSGSSELLIPAVIDDGSDVTLPCTEVGSCADRVGRLVNDVGETLPDQLPIRKCTSSIGGDALCVDFGEGNYLVGDAPYDGEAELGFCTGSDYYHVTGPGLDGGIGPACPDDPGGNRNSDGGDTPTTRECTSSNGGEAVCFDFADGSYIVYDPHDDGQSELGFCTNSGYSYLSAPSGTGEADAECPAGRSAG